MTFLASAVETPGDLGRQVADLPGALRVQQRLDNLTWWFDLTQRPNLDWPIYRFRISGFELVSNRIAGVLAVLGHETWICSPSGITPLQVRPTSIGEAEIEIYEAAADVMGPGWLETLAESSANILNARQQRLELLHCIGLRLCEDERLAPVGRLIDRHVTGLAMRPLKTVHKPLSGGETRGSR